MRGRLSFALIALTLLSFLQGLSALFGVLFGIFYEGIFPEPDARWLLLAVLPLGALLASALPFSLWVERATLIAWAVGVAAIARVPLSLPHFHVRYAAAVLVVAAGAIFLGKAVGFMERRLVAAGAATAFVLDQLLRLAGWSYDISLRASWLPVQGVLAAATIAVAIAWRRQPAEEAVENPLERRAGGVRLRGAVALGCILFLQLNVLARAEVAHRWIGVPYPTAALALITGGGIAVLLLLGAPGPIGRRRPAALLLAGLALAGAVAPRFAQASPTALLVLFAVAHCSGLLLLDRALVPAGGRRRGWRLAAGLATMLALSVAWVLTFYYAFTLPPFEGRTGEILVAAAALLAAALALTPRPFATAPILRQPLPAAAALAALLAVATLLARRPARADLASPLDALRVATFNVRYGYGEDWAWDLERIARTIEESGAHVVALQEVPAGPVTAFGADVPLWLGRRLGARALFAPSINGLLGETILTRLPVIESGSEPLPPPRSDRKVLARALLDAHGDTVAVYGVHFGIYEDEQRVQLEATLPFLGRGARAIFLGDLNAGPDSHVARTLRQAGFRDAFEVTGSPGEPTWPASRPARRIDWIWVRGWPVGGAMVSPGAGSDHRLVWASIPLRR